MKRIRYPTRQGHLLLPVAEADRILQALENTQVIRRLGGQERQLLSDTVAKLRRARAPATGHVEVTEDLCLALLRCISATQTWWSDMLDEFVE